MSAEATVQALFGPFSDVNPALESFCEASTSCPTVDAAAKQASAYRHRLQASVTVITSKNPVTKSFSLSDDGKLEKRTSANVSDGDLAVKHFHSLKEFCDLLHTLMANQCLTYGIPHRDGLKLMSSATWVKEGRPDTATPRTKTAFQWPSAAGILMLDYDAPKDGSAHLNREELFAMLYGALPSLVDSDALWLPSTSSEIYNSETGDQLAGVKGQRIYFMVADAADIPRAGNALLTHLWAAGHGQFEVSSSGSMLERGGFDASVWQTNRIDFAGGASCDYPLEQRRGDPVLTEGVSRTVDSRMCIPEPSPEILAAANSYKSVARSVKANEAAEKRATWKVGQIASLSAVNSSISPDTIARMVDHAVDPDRHQLIGDWQITVVGADGNESTVSVAEILNNPAKYNQMNTLDPLEPDYDGQRPVGKLFLTGRQYLYSFAHGGTTFALSRQLVRIEKVTGRERDAVDSALQVMKDSPDIYQFGTTLVTVRNGRTHALNEAALRYWLGGVVQFWHWKTAANNQRFEVLDDPSSSICKAVLSGAGQGSLKPLRDVITAPTLRNDGSVFDLPGYDHSSRLLLDVDQDEMRHIPANPTEDQARKALQVLWSPFSEFPFVDELAKAAHLAALLTAAIRPAVPTSPAFGYDAPVQGSGKTLLAQCVAAISTGLAPEIYPHISGSDDGEMRKRLFSALLGGERAIVLDNILGTFDSAAMASLLTTDHFKDRILGKSEVPSVPNNAIVLLTGNNMVLAGDMARRVLVCRIDPQMERPFARSFDLNPLAYCLANRQRMIAAALTLVRYCLNATNRPIAAGSMASFEQWDRFVRQTICHIDNTIAVGEFGDVMDLVVRNQAEDPAQESLRCLLQALQACFPNKRFTSKNILSICESRSFSDSKEAALSEAVTGILAGHKITATGIGKMLFHRKDRINDGLQLKVVNNNKNARQWQVVGLPGKTRT